MRIRELRNGFASGPGPGRSRTSTANCTQWIQGMTVPFPRTWAAYWVMFWTAAKRAASEFRVRTNDNIAVPVPPGGTGTGGTSTEPRKALKKYWGPVPLKTTSSVRPRFGSPASLGRSSIHDLYAIDEKARDLALGFVTVSRIVRLTEPLASRTPVDVVPVNETVRDGVSSTDVWARSTDE